MDLKTAEKLGNVKIADEVLASIAGLAATEAEGVASLTGDLKHESIAFSSAKLLSKGVNVEVKEGQVYVRLSLVLDGTVPIPAVCQNVQDKVKTAIESMTGMETAEVQVTVAGVTL